MVVHPSFFEAFRFWLKLGFISFGGPAGQIAIMHQEIVEKKKWISNDRFLNALNYCMLLPGPEAQQLTIYIGWLLHKIPGGIVAGSLFVIPSMFILFALSYIYAAFGNVFLVESFFSGLKASVMAIVFAAVIKIGKIAEKFRAGRHCRIVFYCHLFSEDSFSFYYHRRGSHRYFALVLRILSFATMQWLKIGMIPIIAISGIAGAVWNLF